MIDRFRAWRSLLIAILMVHIVINVRPRRRRRKGRHRVGGPLAAIRERRRDEEWGAALKAMAARITPAPAYA